VRARFFLFILFYVLSFPSRSPTDLAVVVVLTTFILIRSYRDLVAALGAVIEEAHSEKVDSFISRKWRQYCLGGFTRDMTTTLTELSRSTIGRIEGDAGVSEVNAFAYLKALRQIAPEYPHAEPFRRPLKAKVDVVNIRRDKL
jgi:hypothetical protein